MKSLPRLMGILNITPDSFSDGGLVGNNNSIIKAAHKLIDDGADIIDIGAESTRPGATPLAPQEEWLRLKEILPAICKLTHNAGIVASIDTRHSSTAKRAIACGIDWVNDVSGAGDKEMQGILANWHGKVVIMHNLGVPTDKNINIPVDKDCVADVMEWLDLRIKVLEKQCINRDRIIIDPGIGFGKTAEQSWQIINNVAEFKKLGVEVLVGHSRKSFLAPPEKKATDRDPETLAVSNKLSAAGVDYLRVHNIGLHKREFKKTY